MKNIILKCFAAAVAIISLGLTSCKLYEGYEDKILLSGADFEVIQKFVVDTEGESSYVFSAQSTTAVNVDQLLTVAIDNSLVAEYNTKNKTSYSAVPESACEISTTTLTIPAGKNASETGILTIKDPTVLDSGLSYIIPVTIKNNEGDMGILEASRTLFLRIARIIRFPAYDMSDYATYYKKQFDNKVVDLPVFTFQVNIWMESWHGKSSSSAPPIHRLCAIESGPTGKSWHLFRFGNRTDDAPDELEWRGNDETGTVMQFYANKRLPLKTWTNLSLTYDGQQYQIWFDGEPDASYSAPGNSSKFSLIQFGMTESGYQNGQRFTGRISEFRIWSRVLSSAEMKSTVTGVDPKSEGLEAYWKFNEGSGTLVKDYSNNGFNIDWPTSGTQPSRPISWVYDDNNKIPE